MSTTYKVIKWEKIHRNDGTEKNIPHDLGRMVPNEDGTYTIFLPEEGIAVSGRLKAEPLIRSDTAEST